MQTVPLDHRQEERERRPRPEAVQGAELCRAFRGKRPGFPITGPDSHLYVLLCIAVHKDIHFGLEYGYTFSELRHFIRLHPRTVL